MTLTYVVAIYKVKSSCPGLASGCAPGPAGGQRVASVCCGSSPRALQWVTDAWVEVSIPCFNLGGAWHVGVLFMYFQVMIYFWPIEIYISFLSICNDRFLLNPQLYKYINEE